MKLINVQPKTKEEGLQKLKEKGVLILNPTYTPVNKLSDREANEIILGEYQNFKKDLLRFNPKKNIPLILVKANICRLLEKPLVEDGFEVLNKGQMIPFPIHYHQEKFHTIVSELFEF